jgi:hypothetical protein
VGTPCQAITAHLIVLGLAHEVATQALRRDVGDVRTGVQSRARHRDGFGVDIGGEHLKPWRVARVAMASDSVMTIE